METPTPKIPLEVIEWLEATLRQRAPDPDASNEREAWAYIGQVRLARQLRGIAQDQINPPEDTP